MRKVFLKLAVQLCLPLLFFASAAPGATVTWIGGSGDWTNKTHWSTGSLPGVNDDVVISLAATITVTHSAGTHTVNSIQSRAAFVLSGGVLAVANTFQASNTITLTGGTLQTATVVATNGASLIVSGSGGTLNGVTVNGVLDVGNSYNNASLTVTNNLTLNGIALVGNPTNSNYGVVNFGGTQALGGNGTVVFGDYIYAGIYYFNSLRLSIGGTTLTLGPDITIHGQNGVIGYSSNFGGPQNVSVINRGIISSDVSGATINIYAQPFSNQELAQGINGGNLYIDSLQNGVGGIVLVSGGTLTLTGTWTNSGTLVESGGTLDLGGSFSLAGLGTLNRTNGSVNLTGMLNNTNTTLALNATTGPWVFAGGEIQGGTIAASSVAPLIISSGTLDGVTVNGSWDVGSSVYGAQLTVLDGLTNNGMLQVGNPTNSNIGVINFSGTQTLGGTGTVMFGSFYNAYPIFNSLQLVTGGTTLTIGSGLTVRGQNGTIGYSSHYGGPQNVSVVNQGTISCDVSNGTIAINAQPFTNQGLAQGVNSGTLMLNGTWINNGTLVESGGTLDLGGSFNLGDVGTLNHTNGMVGVTGMLNNTNTTLVLNAATGPWVLAGGDIQGGTISASSVAPLIISSGTLDGVTINGNLDVGSSVNGAQLTVLDGLTNNGTLLLGNPTNSNYGVVNFNGTQTLGGTGTVVFGDYVYAGTYYYNSLRLSTGGTALAIGPGITIHGQKGVIGYNVNFGGPQNVSVINQGVISSDVSGGMINIYAQPFSNYGLAQVVNGGSLTLNSTWINSGSLVESSGTLNLGGIFSWTDLGTLNRTNGTVNVTGTLNNTNTTLALNTVTGPWVLAGGDIQSGTIVASSAAPLIISSGTLDGVTVNGSWDVGSSVGGAQLTVLDGLTNNGTMQVGNPTNSNYGGVNFNGTQTLGGTGTVVFGDNNYNALRLPTGDTALTIGSGLTIVGQNGAIGYSRFYAWSAKFMGEFRFGKFPQVMI